jgi:hypothetical protein
MREPDLSRAQDSRDKPPVDKPTNPPAVIIRLEFERPSPRIVCDYLHESDAVRMLDWLDAHPQLVALLEAAYELRRAA